MMKFNLRTSLILLSIGFIIGFWASFLFTGPNKGPTIKKEVSSNPKQLKKEAVNIEESYQKQIANLQDQNLELQQNLEVTQSLLEQAKQAAKQKEINIKKIIEPKSSFARELLRQEDDARQANDSSPCDSLVAEVIGYIDQNHRKDSLYEVQLIQVDSVVTVKDDLIHANEKAYTNLNLLFGQSLTAQESLTKENKLLQRQFKRQRFKNKLVTEGVMIISAKAINYL